MACTVYILVVVAMVRGSTRGEGFVKQPGDDDLTTFVGQPLVVPCVFDHDYDVKEWRTNEESSKLITDSNCGVSQIREEFRHRYELLDDGRDFSLVIKSPVISETQLYCSAGAVFSYKLRYIVGSIRSLRYIVTCTRIRAQPAWTASRHLLKYKFKVFITFFITPSLAYVTLVRNKVLYVRGMGSRRRFMQCLFKSTIYTICPRNDMFSFLSTWDIII